MVECHISNVKVQGSNPCYCPNLYDAIGEWLTQEFAKLLVSVQIRVASPYKRKNNMAREGNCYVTCEALYHLLGGKEARLTPMHMHHEGKSHWFLRQVHVIHDMETEYPYASDVILDPTVSQFKTRPDYSTARGCGFLTKEPSKKAKALMSVLVWK